MFETLEGRCSPHPEIVSKAELQSSRRIHGTILSPPPSKLRLAWRVECRAAIHHIGQKSTRFEMRAYSVSQAV
jgi:hypothetical protein